MAHAGMEHGLDDVQGVVLVALVEVLNSFSRSSTRARGRRCVSQDRKEEERVLSRRVPAFLPYDSNKILNLMVMMNKRKLYLLYNIYI